MSYSKPKTLSWPWSADQVESLDSMLQELYLQSANLNGGFSSHALLDGGIARDTIARAPTRGDLVVGITGPKWDRLAIGATARLLRSNGTDPSWAQAVLTTDVTGILPIANGGTGKSTAPTDGQLLIGKSSDGSWQLATLSAGTNITITNGGGTISIAASGGGGASPWTLLQKSAATSRNNNAGSGAGTVVADPDLAFAMVANTTYVIRGRFFIRIDEANLGNDLVYRITGPATPTLLTGEIRRPNAGLTYSARLFNAYDAANVHLNVQDASAGSDSRGVVFLDLLVQNGANAGTFAFSWISGSSTANSAVLRKGSYMEYLTI